MTWSAHACMLKLPFDPLLNIGAPVSDVSANSESGWSFTSVSPLVQGPNGHAEVLGEILDGHELFVGCHRLIVSSDPFGSLSIQCQQPFREPFRRLLRPGQQHFPGSRDFLPRAR